MSMPTRAGAPAPRSPARPPQESSSSLDPGPLAWLGDPDTILLVEDDAADVLLVEELLADSGMRASLTAARSLAEATDLISQGMMPGCILLDLHCPTHTGRTRSPGCSPPPRAHPSWC